MHLFLTVTELVPYLVSGGGCGGLGVSGPTWPPAVAADSDPWPREALAGGAGALTGAGLVSSVLEDLAAGGEGGDAEDCIVT